MHAATYPVLVNVTKTKCRVKQDGFNDFTLTLSYPGTGRRAEAGDGYKCRGMEMWGKHQKKQQNRG